MAEIVKIHKVVTKFFTDFCGEKGDLNHFYCLLIFLVFPIVVLMLNHNNLLTDRFLSYILGVNGTFTLTGVILSTFVIVMKRFNETSDESFKTFLEHLGGMVVFNTFLSVLIVFLTLLSNFQVVRIVIVYFFVLELILWFFTLKRLQLLFEL